MKLQRIDPQQLAMRSSKTMRLLRDIGTTLMVWRKRTYEEIWKERWDSEKQTLLIGGITSKEIARVCKKAPGVHTQRLTNEIIGDNCWPHEPGLRKVKPVMVKVDRLTRLQEVYATAATLKLKLLPEETIFYLQPQFRIGPEENIYFATRMIEVGFSDFVGCKPYMQKFISHIWGDPQRGRIGWQWVMKHFFPPNPSHMMHTAPYGDSHVIQPDTYWIFDGIDANLELEGISSLFGSSDSLKLQSYFDLPHLR